MADAGGLHAGVPAYANARPARLVVVMGVSGCGKTTVGRLLARQLGAAFLDGDDFHPATSKEKMRAGMPLSDADRWQWLGELGRAAGTRLSSAPGVVVIACSALRRRYRDAIAEAAGHAPLFAFLDGPQQLIAERLARRRHEFMNSALLGSQFATLERPGPDENVLAFSIEREALEIAAAAASVIHHLNSNMVLPKKDS